MKQATAIIVSLLILAILIGEAMGISEKWPWSLILALVVLYMLITAICGFIDT